MYTELAITRIFLVKRCLKQNVSLRDVGLMKDMVIDDVNLDGH